MRYLLALAFCFVASSSWAATYTAAGCSEAQVATAVSAELATPADGDIIAIPAGSCTWASQLAVTFTHSVTVQGAGAISATTSGSSTTGSDLTAITDGVGGAFQLTTISGKSLRVTGIEIIGSASAANGSFQIIGASTAVRFDHNHVLVTTTSSVGFYTGGSVVGVADHDWFDSGAGGFVDNPIAVHNGQDWNGSSDTFGDASWADTDHFGSSQFFFFEDCRWSQADIGDAHDGARYVIRHSTITGTHGQMYNHGLTNSRGRSMRAAEIYLNTFTRSAPDGAPSFSNNGGTLLYWGNTSTDYRYLVGLDYTRKDNGTYGYGSTPSGWGNCTGAGTFTAWDGTTPGYPCMDQPGRGSGDLLNGPTTFPSIVNTTTGMISNVHQALVPVMVWNNTFNDAGFSPEGYLSNGDATLLTDNKDFYQQFDPTYGESGSWDGTKGINQSASTASGNCTAGVGWWDTTNTTLYVCNPTNTWTVYYQPYTYPHPLTGIVYNPHTPFHGALGMKGGGLVK